MHVVVVTDWPDFQNRVIALRMGFPVTCVLEPGQTVTRSFEDGIGSRHVSQDEVAILYSDVNATGVLGHQKILTGIFRMVASSSLSAPGTLDSGTGTADRRCVKSLKFCAVQNFASALLTRSGEAALYRVE